MRKIAFLIVLFFLLISLARNVFDYQRNISFYEETKINFEKATLKNKELILHKQANSSPFEVEKNLRNKQNLLRKNEIIVIIPSPSPIPIQAARLSEPPYRQWIRLFFQ
jgi:hypothetical protein